MDTNSTSAKPDEGAKPSAPDAPAEGVKPTAPATPAEGAKPPAPDTPPAPAAPTPSNDDLDSWKAQSRKWEERAKANLAEVNRLTAERDAHLQQVAAAEAEKATLLKEAVAALKGVPAARITGSTRSELEADADRFLEELKNFPTRGYVPTAGQGGEAPQVSVVTGRERAREALGKTGRD